MRRVDIFVMGSDEPAQAAYRVDLIQAIDIVDWFFMVPAKAFQNQVIAPDFNNLRGSFASLCRIWVGLELHCVIVCLHSFSMCQMDVGMSSFLATPGCTARATVQLILLRLMQLQRCLLMRVVQMQQGKMKRLVGKTRYSSGTAAGLGVSLSLEKWQQALLRLRQSMSQMLQRELWIIAHKQISVGKVVSDVYPDYLIILLLSLMISGRKQTGRHSSSEQEVLGISLIENEVQNKLVNPEQTSYCSCNICQSKYELKEIAKTFLRQTNSTMKIEVSKMQEFFSMISSVSQKQYLKLDVPEICFFSRGEPRKLFKSNNAGVHQIDITASVKKNLINVYLENKRTHPGLKRKQSSKLSFLKGTMEADAHIKHFDAVVPSYKHGDSEKQPKTFIFHSNPKMDENPSAHMQRDSDEEICLIKYQDKGYELLNEKQLRAVLKSPLSLRNVELIQSYIKPSDQEDQIFEANFNCFKKDEYPLMFSRSLVQVKIDVNLINKFSRDYIPVEHLDKYQMEVLKAVPQEFCIYQTYKMVHYMELMKDVKIEKLGTLWLMENSGDICFFGLVEFEWRPNEKVSVDIGEIEELKQLVNSELTDFQQELLRAWENMKSRKQKHLEKVEEKDEEREREIESIKLESQIRIAKEESKSRKKSFAEGHRARHG